MCTYHSIQRANERTRYNGNAAVRFVEKGIERGKTAEDFKQDERQYLASVPYNGFCLIISEDGVCVTLYPLPEWFGKKRHYDGKVRIRNAKRYASCTAMI